MLRVLTIEDDDVAASEIVTRKIKGLLPTLRDWRDSWIPVLRGSVIGFIFGVLPGGGLRYLTMPLRLIP